MPAASMPANNPLFDWLETIRFVLNSDQPLRVSGPFGDFDVEYHLDVEGDNEVYALIGFMLPDDDDILVEIENAYGAMTGIRIYLDLEPGTEIGGTNDPRTA